MKKRVKGKVTPVWRKELRPDERTQLADYDDAIYVAKDAMAERKRLIDKVRARWRRKLSKWS
jgi:hypothetical protein